MENSSKIKLSVVVQANNFEKYVRKCLDSILMQKVNFEYELLCSDDCSTDNSLAILEEYQSKFPNIIKVVKNAKNLGSAKTALKLYSLTQGQYMTVIDGDDYLIDENRFRQQVDFLDQNPDFTGVASNTIMKYEDNSKEDELIVKSEIPTQHTVEDFISARTYFHTSAIMFRNIYKNRYPNFLSHEYGEGDWIRAIMHSSQGNIGYIDKIVSVYRVHNKGAWNKMNDFQKMNRNTYACVHFNQFLEKKYDQLFASRIKIFVEHIIASFPKEMSWNRHFLSRLQYEILLMKDNKSLNKI